ncbi:unnamed protein product [Brachionus calyciflorus]|uniref:Uncharacterized protein n=1 Tax=Brachionus calyciflorus TaxID=104777 RepID=A0A814K5R2_9BILA|nr:unnamed protein product [Brachionus calyciflorus]
MLVEDIVFEDLDSAHLEVDEEELDMALYKRKEPSKSKKGIHIDQEIDDLTSRDRYLVDKRKQTTRKTYWKRAKPGCPGRLHSTELDPYSALEKAIDECKLYEKTSGKSED